MSAVTIIPIFREIFAARCKTTLNIVGFVEHDQVHLFMRVQIFLWNILYVMTSQSVRTLTSFTIHDRIGSYNINKADLLLPRLGWPRSAYQYSWHQ